MRSREHSDAFKAFVRSMELTVEDWREGTSYNLDALKQIPEAEMDELIGLLADKMRTNPDWRQAEALRVIATPNAVRALQAHIAQADPELRMHIAEQLSILGEPADIESSIIEALRNTNLFNGLSYAIDTAVEHPSPRIQETLLDLALNGTDGQRIHCAALALYLGGKADEPFDWNHRPFFLRFLDEDRRVQIEAYRELCERLGVAPRVP